MLDFDLKLLHLGEFIYTKGIYFESCSGNAATPLKLGFYVNEFEVLSCPERQEKRVSRVSAPGCLLPGTTEGAEMKDCKYSRLGPQGLAPTAWVSPCQANLLGPSYLLQ